MSYKAVFYDREVEKHALARKRTPARTWKESVVFIKFEGISPTPGTPVLVVDEPATDEHKARFKLEYHAYLESKKPKPPKVEPSEPKTPEPKAAGPVLEERHVRKIEGK